MTDVLGVEDLGEWDVASTGTITPELRDTYCMWRVAPGSRVLWLSEEQFAALPRQREPRSCANR